MASALETTTLLYRTEHPATTLPALCDSLTALGRKVKDLLSLPELCVELKTTVMWWELQYGE